MILEEELIKKAIARDPSAIEALYDHYAPLLLGVCYRYCGNREDAEDILHDGFIKIIGSIHTFEFRSNGSFHGWIKRIMVNTALNYLRTRKNKHHLADFDSIQEIADLSDDEGYHDEERCLRLGQEKILELICELPVGYRTVFNMYVFEQYGHKEIAGILKCSENTSKSQLLKARALLRKKMNHLVNIKLPQTYEKV
ncbi:MAG: RNA polymerase sigma factor [Bacteroidales bacterium]|jgi:RNA polymerase sigma-70 factor (ECF subfamily)|nr:RNA polymerase sigma factor [Bacteroidales bacterium]